MNASQAIQFIETMRGYGMKEQRAKETIALIESQQGELATKADLEQVEKRLEASIDQLRTESRKDIERLEAGQDRLKEGIRGNRWAIGIAISPIVAMFAAMIGGFAFFAMQISDMRTDIRQLLSQQISRING